jgi:hypothetical protein
MDHGVPVTNDGREDVSSDLHKQIAEQLAEIKSLDGITVTGVRVPGGDAPPRFSVLFEQSHPMYLVRQALEARKFDVGNELKPGEKDLSFYVTKRVTKGTGWSH